MDDMLRFIIGLIPLVGILLIALAVVALLASIGSALLPILALAVGLLVGLWLVSRR